MSARLPLSVLLLARDETAAIAALCARVSVAAEVVVVWDPTGDPALPAAAEAAGARVFHRALDGFGAQRGFALARCTQPWVLWIDADEVPDAALIAAIRAAIESPGDATHFHVLRRGFFLGRRIRHCGWRDEWIVRLFRRELARFDDARVHERLRVDGQGSRRLAGALDHHSYPTWEACVAKLTRYAAAGAADARRAGRRAGPLDLAFRPPLRFLRMAVLQGGLLDGPHGVALCGLAAAQVFLKYAALWADGGGGHRGGAGGAGMR
jgi:hypothetical protein